MISPQEALFRLRDGNRRYVTTLRSPIVHLTLTERLELIGAQAPFAIVLGCSDSRVPVEVVFDQGVGDLFVIRVAGNVAMSPQIGSIEYAALTFGTKLVVVLGHTHCGAVQATYQERQKPGGLHSDHLKGIVQEVWPAFDAFPDQIFRKNESEIIRMAVRANVRNMVERVQTESHVIAELVSSSSLLVVGAEYDVDTGSVEFFDGLAEKEKLAKKNQVAFLKMRVGLFIPCYVDQFYPRVAISTLELLEKAGCNVFYPLSQTCCGQPLANAGYASSTVAIAKHFVDQFETCEYIVAPSGSCVLHVREHFPRDLETDPDAGIQSRIFELCEFLTDVIGLDHLECSFPHRVGLHASCHGLRGLRLGRSSERMEAPFDKVRGLLSRVQGIELVELNRADECCGFGGTFAVKEEVVSVAMGRDRIRDHLNSKAEFITGTDMSCLMHLEGIVRREGLPVRVKHIAEILNGATP